VERLEGRLLERVGIAFVDAGLARLGAQLRDDLPLLALRREVVARVLYPDDRNLGRTGFLDHGADVRDDAVPLVRAAHDAVLHVDHEDCGVRPVLEGRHLSPLVARRVDVNRSC
jgi:hypothetical protein